MKKNIPMRKISILAYLAVFFLSWDSFALSLFGNSSKPREYIYITGSSTISPLASTISEEFARIKNLNNYGDDLFPTPIVESIGTGAGFRSFCKGNSLKYPDFVNASRRINKREIYLCKDNGVIDIARIKIGYDGIVFGNYIKHQALEVTKDQLFMALAKKVYDNKSGKLIDNPYKKWSDIDKNLPNEDIKIFGPPKSSGTRDIFKELVMVNFCRNNFRLIQSYPDRKSFDSDCPRLREDGVFAESGENDDVIIQKLKENPKSYGIFGYNFLATNKHKIHPAIIDGVKPSFKAISLKQYYLSRPLYIYFKVNSLSKVPEMKEFIEEIINSHTIGNRGYLTHSGLIPLSKNEFERVSQEIKEIINE